MPVIPPLEALERLKAGNRRFMTGASDLRPSVTPADRVRLLDGQEPFAIVLGCSDSRVPAELVFDSGFGDLFVIRIAGNIVAPSQIASVEFAATRFRTRLVVVLGHSRCGAIAATLDAIFDPSRDAAPTCAAIVDRVRPSIEPLLSAGLGSDRELLARVAVEANVRASVAHLRTGSPALEQMIADGELLVVGAEYKLETGEVHFFGNGFEHGTGSPIRSVRYADGCMGTRTG